MTITLEAGHTYRTRDGKAEHTILRVRDGSSTYGAIAEAVDNNWWAATGRVNAHHERRDDLVEEVLPTAIEPPNPVRQRTVTEIVPGDYERLRVDRGGTEGEVWISVIPRNPMVSATMVAMNVEELRALAATATQLADALDIIASESQS